MHKHFSTLLESVKRNRRSLISGFFLPRVLFLTLSNKADECLCIRFVYLSDVGVLTLVNKRHSKFFFYWTRHLLSASFQSRTALPLVGQWHMDSKIDLAVKVTVIWGINGKHFEMWISFFFLEFLILPHACWKHYSLSIPLKNTNL